MKIVKCDVNEYLTKYLGFIEEQVGDVTIESEEDLEEFLEKNSLELIWSYPIEELDYLLDKEKEWQIESGEDDYEAIYVLLFERLWEVEQ